MDKKEFSSLYWSIAIVVSISFSTYGMIGLSINYSNFLIKTLKPIEWIYLLSPLIIVAILYILIIIITLIVDLYKTWNDIRYFDTVIIGCIDKLLEIKDDTTLHEGIKELKNKVNKYFKE